MITPEERKVLNSFAEKMPQADPGAHNNLAIVYYNKGLYDEAIEELERALEIDPGFALAKNNLDIILRKTGRLEEQVEKLVRSIDKDSYDEKKTLELADMYRKLNKHSHAIIYYKKVLDSNPNSFEGHYGLGATLKYLRKYDDALEEIRTALGIKNSPEVYRIMGEIYLNKGVIDLAIKNFQEALVLNPESAETHFLLGFALGEKGKIKESLDEVRKAIALNPSLAKFESDIPLEIKARREQWEFLKERLGISTATADQYQFHYNMGISYRNKGLFDEAKKEFDECWKLRAEDPDLYFEIAEVNILQNKLSEASDCLKKALAKDVSSADYANAFGVVYIMEGKLNEALEWFEKALNLDEEHPQTLNNIAVVQYNLGRVDEAIENYEKAIILDNLDASFNLGIHFLKKGEYGEALRLFRGKRADDYFGRGLVYMAKGNDEKALESFKKAISILPNHAGAHYNIGFISTKIGKYEDGLNAVRKGMEIEPNYENDRYRLSLESELPDFGLYFMSKTTEKPSGSTDLVSVKPVETSVEDLIREGENYFNQKDFDRALNKLEGALSLDSDHNKAARLKAELLYQTENAQEAINFLSGFIKMHPGDIDAMISLAHMFKETNELNAAKEIYTELLKLNDNNTEWLNEMAEILYDIGDLEEAEKLFNKGYDLDKKSVSANLGLLRLHLKKKNLDEASCYMEFLEAQHSDIHEFNILAGIYWVEKHDFHKATQYLQKAIEIDASHPLAYYHLGLINIQNGAFENACDNWKKALLLSPDEELVTKIKHCLRITVELSEFLKKEV